MAREQTQADRQEASLLDRRSYLKMAGSAAAAVAVGSGTGTAADPASGFGEGGYGQVAYGGRTAGSAPTVERFSVSKSEQLGDSRMFSVRWAVADADGDLDVVEVVVSDGSADVNFSVEDVTGASASGWELFQFPVGTLLDVTLRATDADDRVVKRSETITL
ncbi:hypothetical protein [Halorussus lipolyticus]|uniref:hypothetical protein n=1 Tax=Halorussus lipolyticus TaxID=3034024 RepID=UPI0023E86530|nr:hypothetical protein [Halorussus sp. DT80]